MPPTYEGSTDFEALAGKKPPPQGPAQVDPNWRPDPKNPLAPPPGIPDSMWQSYLSQDLGPNGQYKNAWKRDPAGMVAGLYKNYVLPQWNSLTPAQKQQYSNTDASGNPFTPGTPEATQWDRDQDTKNIRDQNATTFDQWADQNLPGVRDAMAGAQAGDSDALAKLQEVLGGIQDPEIAKYVGDYISQGSSAGPDQRDVDAQTRQLSKLEGLSDPSITAEEKLMMEMSRRQTESDLRGQRGAIKNDLQARGVYGSGAEITQNAMAQQEAAQRQALEMLGAQANASKRAMDALHGAADLSSSMRGSSAQESQFRGGAADSASQFNASLKRGYDEWKTKQQAENNRDAVDRAKTAFTGQTGVTSNRVKDVVGLAGLGLNAAEGKTGNRTSGTGLVSDSAKDTGILFDKDRTEQELKNL